MTSPNGITIEIEAYVLGTHTFSAAGTTVAKVTVLGTPGGPMGQGIQCKPGGVFELDASMEVFSALSSRLTEPARFKFSADLKPINVTSGYVVHLLSLLP